MIFINSRNCIRWLVLVSRGVVEACILLEVGGAKVFFIPL